MSRLTSDFLTEQLELADALLAGRELMLEPQDLAPTAIPHPAQLGAAGSKLRYVGLAGVVELKIAAGRVKDRADVFELIRANPGRIDAIRQHLASVHGDYLAAFDSVVSEAQKDDAR